eukprot:gnl/Hemi2/18355_TR6091_c0_g1_i1.p1 gnl/Hemi2/18355_TR6091_c0_g1~~gnl/Hemi2/18355_TR6091_c0_g1_i1.p1  ORF type:complete len:438 (-),score=112.07 gnl/Hemi2/18355_TR6091_c0_g1_i1:45-1358(-)
MLLQKFSQAAVVPTALSLQCRFNRPLLRGALGMVEPEFKHERLMERQRIVSEHLQKKRFRERDLQLKRAGVTYKDEVGWSPETRDTDETLHPPGMELTSKKVWEHIENARQYTPIREELLPNVAAGTLKGKKILNHKRRTGVIARKLGMMADWDKWGTQHPLTVFQIVGCQVTQVKTRDKEGYDSVQLASGPQRLHHFTKPLLGHFAKAGVTPKRHLYEFRVHPECLLPIGHEMDCRHFVPGQFVDIRGKTKGKGFAGGMKRHGFSGGCASHGNSLAHRTIGSIGQRKQPGRVFKGKRMPGRMGGKWRTQQNLWIYKIDVLHNLVYIKGCCAGPDGTYVLMSDAIKKSNNLSPFPTYFADPAADKLLFESQPDSIIQVVASPAVDPYAAVEKAEAEDEEFLRNQRKYLMGGSVSGLGHKEAGEKKPRASKNMKDKDD